MSDLKLHHKIAVSAVSIFVLICLAAGAYIYWSDTEKPAGNAVKSSAQQYKSLPPPVQPAANAPEGVSIEALDSPVAVGANTSLIVSTNAGSQCTIKVVYNGVLSTDSGLTPKKADAYGNVTWSWTVGTNTPLGTWPVTVNCSYNGRSGVVVGSLQVTRS